MNQENHNNDNVKSSEGNGNWKKKRNRRRHHHSKNRNQSGAESRAIEAESAEEISAFDAEDRFSADVDECEELTPEITVSIDDGTPVNTIHVTGVRFKASGKVYYFDKGDFSPNDGSFVIVETARGLEFGEVAFGDKEVKETALVLPLRKIVRLATDADIEHNKQNKLKEEEAFRICTEKVEKHGLDMKLIEAQYSFDNSKLLFYFTSATRVDFRELVKDLASVFKTRIELRQIGIRDEAKLMGGLGACGRPLCCSTFLSDFVQVSIRMAKEQNLSLNSGKISGCCGRLMCCLQYEYSTYAEETAKTPPVDSVVKTPDGIGVVTEINPLAATIKVRLNDKPDTPPEQYKRDKVTVISRPSARKDND